MLERKYISILIINFLIFIYCSHNHISINLGNILCANSQYLILKVNHYIKDKFEEVKLFFHNYSDIKKKLIKLHNENLYLKAKLSINSNTNENVNVNLIPAEVIGKSFLSDEKIIFINKGENSNVFEGNGVISKDGVVGIVVKSYTNFSKVLYLTDVRFNIDVYLKNSSIYGLLTGSGKDYCIVKYIPITDQVAIGEKVFTSDFSNVFPHGVPVGIVTKIQKNNLYKVCYVKPLSKYSQINKVFIIKK